jgi:hypothetical protein
MKYIKMLGLAVVAAAAVMAFIGAGTASATVLCKTATNPCTEKHGDVTIHGTLVGSATLESGSEVLDTCTASMIHGKVEQTGSATSTVSGKISELTWGSCTNPTTTVTLGSLEIHHIAGTNNGTLTAIGTEVTVSGIFGVSCTYGAGTGLDLGTVKGGSPSIITISTKVKKTAGSFVCPSEPTWTAEYKVTEPSPLFVSAS